MSLTDNAGVDSQTTDDSTQRVVVTVRMPFLAMVFMVKWSMPAIPAAAILVAISVATWGVAAGRHGNEPGDNARGLKNSSAAPPANIWGDAERHNRLC
jgi:hypothetical protein